MMDIDKSETFKNFSLLYKALLFLIKCILLQHHQVVNDVKLFCRFIVCASKALP